MTNPPPVAPVVTDEMVQAVEAYLATLPASSTAELRAIIARQDKQLNETTDTFFAQKAELERLRAALQNIRALAAKRQHEGGPDGNFKTIEEFAIYGLEGKNP